MKLAVLLFLFCAPVFPLTHIERSNLIAQKSFTERSRIRNLSLGEDYEIDGSTYTAEGSTATITGEDYVISGETYTYTVYGTTVLTSVIIGEYDEAKGGWLTNIAGVIVMVIGGVVYFLHKKKNE